jgi:hypothetical protein
MTTATRTDRKVTAADITAFCDTLTELSAESYRKSGYTFGIRIFEPSRGGRAYTRICSVDLSNDGREVSRSAHCFVKVSDGSLWKCDGGKGPAKNFSRGSVYDTPATVYVAR